MNLVSSQCDCSGDLSGRRRWGQISYIGTWTISCVIVRVKESVYYYRVWSRSDSLCVLEIEDEDPNVYGEATEAIFYSTLRGWFGTRNQRTMLKAIIATILKPRIYQYTNISTMIRQTYNGCKLQIPLLAAMAPVMKGNKAEPAWPNPAIQPIHPVSSHGGRIRAEWFITMG